MGSLTQPRLVGGTPDIKPAVGNDVARRLFWDWFAETIAPDGAARLEDDSTVVEIADRLQSVHPDLSFELWGPEGDAVQFVISADGLLPLFPEVLALVRSAPSMEHWQVVAFRPRRSVGARIKARDIELSGDQIWYRWEPMADRMRLALFIESLSDDNADMMCAASYVLLDMALGEYDAATKIASVEHYPLTSETMGPALRPLRELAQDIDQFFAGSVH
ncbi:MAG: hypothetical protein MJE12_31290 [Alphaproteobacteria bacterium]|nr:hypothetical protein [Alphaproteobacteria bacterium]